LPKGEFGYEYATLVSGCGTEASVTTSSDCFRLGCWRKVIAAAAAVVVVVVDIVLVIEHRKTKLSVVRGSFLLFEAEGKEWRI
jgi:anti-sigma-K factor RskA